MEKYTELWVLLYVLIGICRILHAFPQFRFFNDVN